MSGLDGPVLSTEAPAPPDAAPEPRRRRAALRSVVLSLLVPGLGHASLGERGRGLGLLAVVGTTFGVGLALGAELPRRVGDGPLSALAFAATSATGLLAALARLLGLGGGDPRSETFEFAQAYLHSAGTMSLLLVLDLVARELRRRG